MKNQKFQFALNSKVAIYVPSTINVDETCENKKQVDRVLTKLSLLFGGATATDAIGGWVCQSGKLVTEKIVIVYSYCKEAELIEKIDAVLDICKRIKIEMAQEAVTLEINGQVAFI